MIDWIHSGPTIAAAFLGSMVEAVEALTIVLAIGSVRGWRSALTGTGAGFALLAVMVILFGPAIATIPMHVLQIVVGALLLLFGTRWLRKAILRSAGVIAIHDEDAVFRHETKEMRTSVARGHGPIDLVAAIAAFKAVVLEGTEVVVIVIGVGAVGNMLVPATLGALAACALVIIMGVMLHRPLSRVPENSLKFVVGVLISSFGIFWFGEGIGIRWSFEDATILVIAAFLGLVSWVAVGFAKHARLAKSPGNLEMPKP